MVAANAFIYSSFDFCCFKRLAMDDVGEGLDDLLGGGDINNDCLRYEVETIS
jgi:hypothetical protein